MNIPLTDAVRRQIERYELRSSCVHCRHYLVSTGACGNGWPNADQRRWPIEPGDPELPICKEFELR